MSHVTVSGVWGEKGKGVTCNGFWGLGREGKGVTCNGFALLCFALLLLCIALLLLEAGTCYGLVALLCFALPLRCHM